MKNFNKLVRDKIPDIIREDGGQPRTEILSAASYISELDKKLDEEIAEYQESKNFLTHSGGRGRGYLRNL